MVILSKSREGANITEEELVAMDSLIYALTENGQSVHAAVVNNPDVIPVSEKTVYRYIDGRLVGKFGKDAGLAVMGEMFAANGEENGINSSSVRGYDSGNIAM